MLRQVSRQQWAMAFVTGSLLVTTSFALAQNRPRTTALSGVPAVSLPDGPVVLHSAEQPRIRVVPVATGLSHPWGLAFRRNGDILITERDAGALRVVRNGTLVTRPIPGTPEVYLGTRLAGLMDIAVHPDDDSLVYLTYSKPMEREGVRGATIALARGRLNSGALTEVRDVFVSEGFGRGVAASRVTFGPDGKLYMTIGGAIRSQTTGLRAQDPATHVGKVVRLNDDGSVPEDNPFVDDPSYLPEIYSLGHRNQLGLAFHPETGLPWASENAPQGGDEVNVILPGRNYGWPVASDSREYTGVRVSDTPWLDNYERPEVLWWPSIAPSGLTFYDGEHFPAWQGNLFVGSMTVGRMQRTGHVERVVFNQRGEEMRREWLLAELKQRIRDIRQGPDGYLYVLTEEDDAALLRIEPARAVTELPGSLLPHRRADVARTPPLLEREWTAEQRGLVERYSSVAIPRNAVRTLLRVPALADRVLPLSVYLTKESTLSPRHRQLLLLRTAWLTQSPALWATHADRALASGLTDEELIAVAEGPSLERWDPFEDALVGFADELFRNSSVTDETWAVLADRFDQLNLIDAVVTVADTTAQAILYNALGVQPDEAAVTRLPVNEVAYRVVVPARGPDLTVSRVEPLAGDGLRVSRTFRQHAAMYEAWFSNPGYVLNPERSGLTPHDRELLILRTGWNTQAVYEWAKHVGSVGRARDHGLVPEWIAQGLDAPGWNATERRLIQAANEMYRDTTVSDETWEALAAEYSTHQMISIVATASNYRKVSMALNALGVQPLPTDERFPVLEGY
ncbi:MAG: PQQ-dependent sugar dehydrogenase [Acidobacteriota bacterium]|nr:PQQ-dependent sugar dehydrogenase [Acidobacteriota bacterium]